MPSQGFTEYKVICVHNCLQSASEEALWLQFPDPVIKIAIEPKSKADLEKMSNGLIKLAQEDPSFHFSRDEETNQTVIEGMGELHLVRLTPCLYQALQASPRIAYVLLCKVLLP